MRQAALALYIGLAAISLAKPVRPGHIPGDRLIANLVQHLRKEPGNAEIYYLIGRAHYAMFSATVESTWLKKGEVEVFAQQEGLPHFPSLSGNISPWDSKSAVKDTPENRLHVGEAIRNLRIAIDMTERPRRSTTQRADAGLGHLTLACTFDSAALLASKIPLPTPYPQLASTKQWRWMAGNEYLAAFRQSIGRDRGHNEVPIFGLQTLVAYEAGQSFLRLRPNAKESREVRFEIDRMTKLPPPNMVTPLILDINSALPVEALLDAHSQVAFDLDGTGRPQLYSWTKPTTAFLVWDPKHESKIESGRQLFGSATWWMLWPNGYEALSALDDNHDGWISGRELRGIALWFDRNGNGRSDPGEVIPIEQTSIAALRTSFDTRSKLALKSKSGLVLRDGRILPTYDWMTQPMPLSKNEGHLNR